MSKASRAKRHQEKMNKRRATKHARRALYASLAGTSKKKKKLARRINPLSGTYKHAHIMDNCGNVGCKKCNPRLTSSSIAFITENTAKVILTVST